MFVILVPVQVPQDQSIGDQSSSDPGIYNVANYPVFRGLARNSLYR